MKRRAYLLIAARPPGGFHAAPSCVLSPGLDWPGWLELPDHQVVRRTRLLMGTIANITLVVPRGETAAAETALEACFSCMEGLEAVLSRFKPDSQVSTLNRTGILTDPHPVLVDLVRQSYQISEMSGGQFDITVLPVLSLYQQYQAQAGTLPPPDAVEAARSLVNYRWLIDRESVLAFKTPGMGITLDGIAKGYIVDAGVGYLVEHGLSDILMEAGGDLMACGNHSQGGPWKIGVRSPRPAGRRLVTHFYASNEAVATSGDYMQPFTADYSQHHILNPYSGKSPATLASATVVAPQLALADALATTLMLMQPADGLAMIRELGLRALLVTKDLKVLRA